ncbi:MAG: TerB family tellurite resistance protein [Planctomycetes bacterium]|nr:TerB family tellurite resistance protein [Planctomycetota bacterium]
MPPRTAPSYWLLRFAAGMLLLLAAGLRLFQRLLPGDALGLTTVLPGLLGFYLSLSSITPLVRALTLHARTRRAWSEAARELFARASLPRRVYYLLTAVAQVDGPISAAERETVRTFVHERFAEAADQLQSWEAQPLQVDDRTGLAARIAFGLDDAELDTLFCWCCLVAFADRNYREPEHRALQEVARGLGIDPGRARQLFYLAKAQHLRHGGGDRGPGPGPGARPAPVDRSDRARALAVLGLPVDATPDAIRRRHRELVRRFHPDAQPHLGPVAQREATERFQEIQRAYEALAH